MKKFGAIVDAESSSFILREQIITITDDMKDVDERSLKDELESSSKGQKDIIN